MMEEKSPTADYAKLLCNFRRELMDDGFAYEDAVKMVIIFWQALSNSFDSQEDNWDELLPD